jgi:hypothetical protein
LAFGPGRLQHGKKINIRGFGAGQEKLSAKGHKILSALGAKEIMLKTVKVAFRAKHALLQDYFGKGLRSGEGLDLAISFSLGQKSNRNP